MKHSDFFPSRETPGESVSVSRRWFLNECGVGLGKMGLAGLMLDSTARAAASEGAGSAPFSKAAGAHFPGKARAVIHLFMAGAPSHIDLFDPKPELEKLQGKPMPPSVVGSQRYAFIRPDAAVMAGQFRFDRYGQSGAEISEVMPQLATIADDICIVRSVTTDQFNHAPAQIFFNTGFSQPGRPSMGSWVSYGLGSETRDLPAFVVMSTGAGVSGGTANWSSGFLPTTYTGVRFRNQGGAILNLANPAGVDATLQRDTLDLGGDLNREQLARIGDPETATRIKAYEMAFRLQTSAPDLLDLKSESPHTLAMYGCDPDTPSFARACLLARRMVERGVRFINIYHEGWDAHSGLAGNHRGNCAKTDRASAALVQDLKQRGLLDSTLVVWGGEFGRTPMVETNPSLGRSQGRDHHPQAYTMWLAGGGLRGGMTYGSTDAFGFHVTEKPVHVHDIQATILHCLGLDHERLTFHFMGRRFRLTDVHGKVVHDLLI
jgi:uncharacterized protein (DUF1501 family)